MLAFLARRLLATVPVVLTVAVLVFLMLRLTPGDPAAIMAGDNASPAQIEEIRGRLGLDRPLHEQFGLWASRLLRGDLGESFFFKRPVAELIGQRVGPTLALATTTMLLSIAVAVPLGTLAAWRHGTAVDRLVMGFSVLGFSVPVFVLGYALIYLFAIRLGWLPVQGYKPLSAGLGPFLHQLVLPSLTLSVIYVALIARITRASLLEVLGEDFVRTARAKGLAPGRILRAHTLRNAILPVITFAGIQAGQLVGGSIVVETVFAWPGIGRLAFEALLQRDYNLLLGVFFLTSIMVIAFNLVTDLVYSLVDPRIEVGA
jgi:peptide/nickel transport system permease protein